ncbi:hypothetical protein ILUMI_22998 [Ignelater luminosus]|uniref:Integrase catalytic domain-containing protein n=1 Tax=Ignelater luminosus TaxID=2038154 RepID=A0A8K0CDC8_IGNLU|nr:hypothetical protein ILUMI_22998 [Ignelater luminosus]
MGKGIALGFKIKLASTRHVLAQRKKVGETAGKTEYLLLNYRKVISLQTLLRTAMENTPRLQRKNKYQVYQLQQENEFCRAAQVTIDNEGNNSNFYLHTNNLLYKRAQWEIPSILQGFHDSAPGVEKTSLYIKQKCFWPNMQNDISIFRNQRKTSLHLKRELLQKFLPLDSPLQRCNMDIVKHLLRPQKAEALVNNIFVRFVIPEQLITDKETNFINEIFKNLCEKLKIKKITTSDFHPQSNAEQAHSVLKDLLSHYTSKDQFDWEAWLSLFQLH